MKKWKVSVDVIFNEKLWIEDIESSEAHKHTKTQHLEIESETWEEALELAKTKFINEKWKAIYLDEQIADRKFLCHTIYNDELYNEAEQKYGK